jgi:Tryptophan-associated transmembrane protein (Trp_oprn_chp)
MSEPLAAAPGAPEPHPPIPGPPNREGSPTAEQGAPVVHTPTSEGAPVVHTPTSDAAGAPASETTAAGTPTPAPETTAPRTPTPADRRSMQIALVAVLIGVMLAVTGAGQAWARVGAAVELPGVGAARLGAAEVTGNDLAPFGGLALLGLVLLVAVAATRGRGRWVVGLALLALGGALAVAAVSGAVRVGSEAAQRAELGLLEGVPGGTALRVDTPRAGPALVVAGGLLLAAAGAEALRRGRRWPALGDAFRAPPDRARPAADAAEPPWEGD